MADLVFSQLLPPALERFAEQIEQYVQARTATLTQEIQILKQRQQALLQLVGQVQSLELAREDSGDRSPGDYDSSPSGDFYRQWLENSPNPIFVVDGVGRILDWNPACEELLGYGSEMIGQPLAVLLLDAPTIERLNTHLKQVFRGETPPSVEITYRNSAGAARYMISQLYPSFDPQGQVLNCIVVNTDISDRIDAEESRRQSDACFRSLFEHAAVGIVQATATGQFLRVNQRFCEIVGYSEAELLQITFQQITHPEDLGNDLHHLQRVIAGEIPTFSIEKRYIRKSGESRWVNLSVSLVRDEAGAVQYAIGVIEDIHQRKQTEAALRESEARFRAIFEQAAVGIVQISPTGQLLAFNQAFQALTGYSETALKGKNFREITHPQNLPLHEAKSRQLFAGEISTFSIEQCYVRPDGQAQWINLTISLVRNKEGYPLYTIGIAEDIQERKRIEAERQQAELALRQSEARFQSLAANMPGVIYRYVIRPDGSDAFTYISPGCLALWGLQPDAALQDAKRVWSLLHPEDVEPFQASIVASLQTLNTWQHRFRNYTTSGQLKWVQGIAKPERQTNGDVVWDGILLDISEQQAALHKRQQVERALERSHTRYCNLAANIPGMIYQLLLHPDGSFSFPYVSPACQAIFAVSAEAAMADAMLLFSLIHPDEWSTFADSVAASAQTLKPYHWVGRVVVNQQIKWLQVDSKPERQPDGSILWDGLLIDITDSQEARIALQQQKELLQTIFDHIPAMLILWDAEQRPCLVNREAERVSGWSLAEMQNMDVLAECFPGSAERQKVWKHIQQADGEWLDQKIRTRTGQLIDTTWANVRLSDGSIVAIGQDITERKRTEESLRLSEARFRRLVQDLHVGVVVHGSMTEVLLCNPTAQQLLATSEERLLGKTICDSDWQIIREDGSAFSGDEHPCAQAIATGQAIRNVVMGVYRPALGDRIWLLVDAEPHVDSDGSIHQVICTFNDITARKYAEDALKQLNEELEARVTERTQQLEERERFIQRIADSTPGILYLYDLTEQRNIYANRELTTLLGYTPAQIQAMGADFLPRLLHPEDLPRAAERIKQFFHLKDANEVTDFEFRMQAADGQWHTLLTRETVFTRTPTGEPQQILGIATDISDRKQAEAKLRESEANLSAAQKIAHIGNWKYELATGKIIWSEEVFRIFGLDPAAGEPSYGELQQIIYPEDLPTWKSVVQAAIDHQIPYEWDHRIMLPDGSLRYVEARGQVITDGTGVVTALFGTVMDISERKQAEAQLKASLEEKELLLKEVHHRVKNNLQVVSSLFSLQTQYIDDPKVLEVLIESQNRINAMALIHEKLYQSTSLAQVDFRDYIHNLTQSLFASYHTKAQRVRLHLQVEPLPISLDTAIRCGLIINELVSNALKHAFLEDCPGEMRLTFVAQPADKICLVVEDDGVGIPPDFDIEQTNSLGLRLVKILTRKLKGELTVTRTKGTRFQLVFPYTPPLPS